MNFLCLIVPNRNNISVRIEDKTYLFFTKVYGYTAQNTILSFTASFEGEDRHIFLIAELKA